MENLLPKSILRKASKNKCMVEQEFFIFLINVERGCRLKLFMGGYSERSGSAQNGSNRSCKREAYLYLHGTVPYRTVPKSRVNAASVEGKAARIKFRQTNSKASGNYGETVFINISFACCQCCVTVQDNQCSRKF